MFVTHFLACWGHAAFAPPSSLTEAETRLHGPCKFTNLHFFVIFHKFSTLFHTTENSFCRFFSTFCLHARMRIYIRSTPTALFHPPSSIAHFSKHYDTSAHALRCDGTCITVQWPMKSTPSAIAVLCIFPPCPETLLGESKERGA